jgi:hypothetical protein
LLKANRAYISMGFVLTDGNKENPKDLDLLGSMPVLRILLYGPAAEYNNQ